MKSSRLLQTFVGVVALTALVGCQTTGSTSSAGASPAGGTGLVGTGRSVTEWPSGLTKYDPGKAYKGYTLYTSLTGDGTVYLIDMTGKPVHKWDMGIAPGMYGRLLPNGNLFYSGRTSSGYGGDSYHMSGKGGAIIEADWKGNKISRTEISSVHHDQIKLPNGNIMAFAWEPVPSTKKALVKGGVPGTEFPDGTIMEEVVVEVDVKGNKVWSWRASDHMNFNDYPVCPENDRLEWLHANAIDYLPADNPVTGKEGFMLSLRHPSTVIIVEKATGNVVWRYGGCIPGEFGKLGAQHDSHVIPKGLPGAGNILIFDNGLNLPSVPASTLYWGMGHSRVIELDKNKKVVWMYEHKDVGWKFENIPPKWKFNSPYIAGAQRLPNGNTLICEGGTARIFEVTRDGEIVWEFINPDRKAVFRAYRYGPDFPGFAGKGLPPTN